MYLSVCRAGEGVGAGKGVGNRPSHSLSLELKQGNLFVSSFRKCIEKYYKMPVPFDPALTHLVLCTQAREGHCHAASASKSQPRGKKCNLSF